MKPAPARAAQGKIRLLVAVAVVLTLYLGWQAWLATLRADLSAHKFAVTVSNQRSDTYVWVSDKVHAAVWVPGSDAGDDSVAFAWGKLVLPGHRLGSGYQVSERSTVSGFVELDPEFELQRHIRNGYELKLSVYVIPRGYYSADFPFRLDPDIELGNAFGRVLLTRGFPAKVIALKYRP
ncbi:hypothetical protein [Lysobacter sp. Root690]|uniref:hypothetical protein n=1 Tax=Lysobacter sp. Root690 TaxID=1736588 RepID=UPI0006F50327|nr:hypothetical protein [Lysobacter sp. Root690]KRB11428.1 hypothetical protein ASD86_03160 [Lysobacter sp. Root690]